MTLDKARTLIDKLVRVAAPGSGASESERVTAALEACKLISENGLIFSASREPKRVPLYRPSRADVYRAVEEVTTRQRKPDPFRPAIAAEDCECGEDSCPDPIFQGERVWRRIKNGAVEYVHADCWIS